MIDYIHAQISIWAKWSVSRSSKGLGFSPISPMFKGGRFGGGYGSQPPAGVTFGSTSDISDMDNAIARLDSDKRAFVVDFYIIGGRSVDIADRRGVTKKRLYEQLATLHHEVLGHLNDVAAGL